MSRAIDIADAVVAALNALGRADCMIAERRIVAVDELPDLELPAAKIDVLPVGMSFGELGAAGPQRDIEVRILVRQITTDADRLQELVDLLEAIGELFTGQSITYAGGLAVCLRVELDMASIDEHSTRLGQFTGAVQLTFRAIV